MKSRVLIASGIALLVVFSATVLSAQSMDVKVERLQAIRHDVSPPLTEMALPPKAPTGFAAEVPIRVVPGGTGIEDTGVVPPWAQLEELPFAGASVTPPPIVNVLGNTDDDNAATVGGRVVPPDTDGAIGAAHYVQWVNLILSIYDKNGVRVFGPVAGNSLFNGFGGACESTNNGDPISLYDQKNDRWVLSQFAINQGLQCVAVSATSNPMGAYFRYAFVIGGANDYPKLGLWLNDQTDLLSFTFRTFGGPGGGVSLDVAAADYASMLAGDPAAIIIFRTGSPFLEGMLPADVDGNNYPTTAAPLFGRYHDTGNQFHLFRIDGIGGTPMLTQLPPIAMGPIDRGLGRIPQPSPGELLDDHSQFTMHRLAYRRYADTEANHQQLLATSTADAGSDRGGKHWIELRNTGAGWNKFQEGLYAPGSLERWMGSIAADQNGNIALGYSASNSSTNPSVRYTSRTPADPLGTLPGGEVTAQAGGGVQTSSNNRWGDYSNMSIDPVDDCTFWYTQEYYANTGSFDFATRIVSFKFPGCGGPPPPPPAITLDSGTCGQDVVISGSNFTPSRELALLTAANTNGWTKGGSLCNGTEFEIGEPIHLPPKFVITDGSGNFTKALFAPPGFCFIEALDFSTCQTSNAVDTSP